MFKTYNIKMFFIACLSIIIVFDGLASGNIDNTNWVEEFNGPYKSWLNVKDFGAVGDGKTDDTLSIEKAFSALVQSHKKGVLYFPSGTYSISRTLEFASSDKKLNPGIRGRRGAVGKLIIGEDPKNTIISWNGEEKGTMFHLAGQTHCRYGRLTFDGNNKAKICVRIERLPELYRNSSYVQINDMIFRNAEFGIYNTDYDKKHDMDAEYSILRCSFFNISDTGIRIDAGNAYDFWIRHCLFEDCMRGVMNVWGDFYVMQSNFLRSKDCDIIAKKHRSGNVRGCYSKDSNQFIRINRGRFVVQNNLIVDTLGDTAISFERKARYESVLILDNKIFSKKPSGTPLIKIESGELDTPVAVIGNIINVKNAIKLNNKNSIEIENKFIDKVLDIDVVELELPQTPPQIKREVFDAKNCSELQKKIDEAVAYFAKNPNSRPIVHLEASEAQMKDDIVIPANIPLKLVGDGGLSCIRGRNRTLSTPKILLRGPSRVRIRDIDFQYGGKEKDGTPKSSVADIMIDSADQKNARVLIGNSWVSGVFADGLKNTKIDLLDHYSASYGPFLRTTLKVVGAKKEMGASRVAMFGGVVIGDQIQAHVLDGGQLFMQDFWHEENGVMTYPWALLSGEGAKKGNFILQSGMIYQQSTNPIIEINGFDGNFTAISNLILGKSQYVKFQKPCDKTSFLSLFGCLQIEKNSPVPQKYLLIDKVSPNSKPIDKKFILEQLKLVRKLKADRIVKSSPKGVTDVRIQRVTARYQNGWGVWIKPEKHKLGEVGVSVEATDWNAVEGEENSGAFLFTRDSLDGELTVFYEIEGDVNEKDITNPLSGKITFSKNKKHAVLLINPRNNDEIEKTKLMKIKISPNAQYSVGTNRQSTRDYISLRDDDSISDVKITLIDGIASETNNEISIDNAKICVWRSLSAGDLTVKYKIVGKPLDDEFQKNINGEIIIPDGANEVVLELAPLNDDLYEPTKSLDIILEPSKNYNIISNKVEIKVYDDDILDLKIKKENTGFSIIRNSVSGEMDVSCILIFTSKDGEIITKEEIAKFTHGNNNVFVQKPVSKKTGKWELQIKPRGSTTMDDVILPDSASRYWWFVSENKIIAIDLKNSKWWSQAKPGKPAIFKTILVPKDVKESGKWISSKTKDEEIAITYDSIGNTLWVMKMGDNITPQTLWKIENVSTTAKFKIWAVGSKNATGKAPTLILSPNRNISTQFKGSTRFSGFVDKNIASGQLGSFHPIATLSAPLQVGNTVFAVKKGKCYKWKKDDNINLKTGILIGDVSGVGDAFSLLPTHISNLLNIDEGILLFTSFQNFGLYGVNSEKKYNRGEEGYATKLWWDPWGRLWVRPFSWSKPAVILEPLDEFKEVMKVKELNSKKVIAFDNEYVYILGEHKKFKIMRMLLNGRGWKQYISLKNIGDSEKYKYNTKTDPTGCHWFIQNKK